MHDRDDRGYRGYIASRPIRASHYPQRVQNTIVRNYAARKGLTFKLSLTEYAMRDCFMMLETLLDELPRLNGVIMFSMFMLPDGRRLRERIYSQFEMHRARLHFALEETSIQSSSDIGGVEETLCVERALRDAPMRGRYEKDGRPFGRSDAFVSALLDSLGLDPP